LLFLHGSIDKVLDTFGKVKINLRYQKKIIQVKKIDIFVPEKQKGIIPKFK